ncbi:hypothetical protein HJC99_04080 [Candidatus Saccharibacteria bacterium]|nr:hypothetical protein [Candidatus Saccharibacteria bacterium]
MDIKPTKALLAKEIDRRQFLGLLGAGALVVTGISGILGGISKLGGNASSPGTYGKRSYGSSSEVNKRRL